MNLVPVEHDPFAPIQPIQVERKRTPLTQDEEQKFQSWYKDIATKTGIDTDPDNPNHKYDYRGAYKEGIVPTISSDDGRYHWPSQHKDDDHPNRFVKDNETGKTLDSKYGRFVDPQKPVIAPQSTPEAQAGGTLIPVDYDPFKSDSAPSAAARTPDVEQPAVTDVGAFSPAPLLSGIPAEFQAIKNAEIQAKGPLKGPEGLPNRVEFMATPKALGSLMIEAGRRLHPRLIDEETKGPLLDELPSLESISSAAGGVLEATKALHPRLFEEVTEGVDAPSKEKVKAAVEFVLGPEPLEILSTYKNEGVRAGTDHLVEFALKDPLGAFFTGLIVRDLAVNPVKAAAKNIFSKKKAVQETAFFDNAIKTLEDGLPEKQTTEIKATLGGLKEESLPTTEATTPPGEKPSAPPVLADDSWKAEAQAIENEPIRTTAPVVIDMAEMSPKKYGTVVTQKEADKRFANVLTRNRKTKPDVPSVQTDQVSSKTATPATAKQVSGQIPSESAPSLDVSIVNPKTGVSTPLSMGGGQRAYDLAKQGAEKIAEKITGGDSKNVFQQFASDAVDMLKGKSRIPEAAKPGLKKAGGELRGVMRDVFTEAQGIKNVITERKDLALKEVADKALKGDTGAFNGLPDDLKTQITKARQTIDTLSKMLADEVEKVVSPGQKISQNLRLGLDVEGNLRFSGLMDPQDLVRRMRDNTGKYVTRNYFAFLRDDYNPSTGAWQDAVEGMVKDDNWFPDVKTPDDAKAFLQSMIARKNIRFSGGTVEIGVGKKRYMTRMDVPDYLRGFLGEIKDPALNYALTVKDLTKNITQMQMFDEWSKLPELFTDKRSSTHVFKVSDLVDPEQYTFGAIAGKYTTTEMADYIGDLRKYEDVYDRVFAKTLSGAKALKTVLNAPTHGRNVIGNIEFTILADNSIFNPMNAKYYKHAGKALAGGDDALYKEMLQHSVVENEFSHNDLINVYDELKDLGVDVSKFRQGVRAVSNTAKKAYSLEDQFFKAAAFTKYREQGMDAAKAAERVYKSFPNYAEVSRFAHGLRNTRGLNALFPFISFRSEALRIFGNAVKEGGTQRYKALGLMFSKTGYNAARLAAMGYGAKEIFDRMNTNDLWFDNLALTDKKKLSLRSVSPFNPIDLYLTTGLRGGNIVTDAITGLESTRDSTGRPKTAKERLTGAAYGVNSMVGHLVRAATSSKKGDTAKYLMKSVSPTYAEDMKKPKNSFSRRRSSRR